MICRPPTLIIESILSQAPYSEASLAALRALALAALTAAAFLAYLRPEAVMDFANRFYLCY